MENQENIQHSTFNVQHRIKSPAGGGRMPALPPGARLCPAPRGISRSGLARSDAQVKSIALATFVPAAAGRSDTAALRIGGFSGAMPGCAPPTVVGRSALNVEC